MAVQVVDAGVSTFAQIPGVVGPNQYRLTVPVDIPDGDVIVVVLNYKPSGFFPINAMPIPGWGLRAVTHYNYSGPPPDEQEWSVIYYKEKQSNEFNVYDFEYVSTLVTDVTVLKTLSVSGARRGTKGAMVSQQLLSGTAQSLGVPFLNSFVSTPPILDGGAGLMLVVGNPYATTSSITAYPPAMSSALGGAGPRTFLGIEHFTAYEADPATRTFTCDQTGAPSGGNSYEGFRAAAVTFAPAFNINAFHGVQF